MPGGQHVNTTDSAVRIATNRQGLWLHVQNEHSQHTNKDTAMKMLRAKLYEREMIRRMEKQQTLRRKSDIGWGSQIRSYVLDDSRIRICVQGETSIPKRCWMVTLDKFIRASLKQGFG